MAYGNVTEDTVYTCTGHPLRSDIANILDWMLNKDFTTAYNSILYTVCNTTIGGNRQQLSVEFSVYDVGIDLKICWSKKKILPFYVGIDGSSNQFSFTFNFLEKCKGLGTMESALQKTKFNKSTKKR